MWLPGHEKKFDDIFSRLDTKVTDGRTDGRTVDGQRATAKTIRLRIASRGKNRKIFLTPTVFDAPDEWVPLGNWVSALGVTGPRKNYDDTFNHLDTIHERDGQTDGHTGRQQSFYA